MQDKKLYDRDFKIKALAKLAANGGNLNKTSDDTGVSRASLREWKKNPDLSEDKSLKIATGIFEEDIADFVEKASRKLMSKIEKIIDSADSGDKITDCVNALEKLSKLRTSNRAEAVSDNSEGQSGTQEMEAQTIQNMLDTYTEAYSAIMDAGLEQADQDQTEEK